jgi:hypothetical protein
MLRAYSVVMMAGKEPKEGVNYGGKSGAMLGAGRG